MPAHTIHRRPIFTGPMFLACAWSSACIGLLAPLAAVPRVAAAADTPAANSKPQTDFKQHIVPLLTRHCFECHRGDKAKGDLRLDQLSNDLKDATTRKAWHKVLEQLTAKAMPPEPKARPSDQELETLTSWIKGEIRTADLAARAAEGRVVLRRLNRVEYQNTIRDLLGVTTDLRELLPPDSSLDGFDNVGEALHVSSFLLERYLEAAETALNFAIVNTARPPLIKKRYSLTETHQLKSTTEKVFRRLDEGRVIMFSSSAWQSVVLSPFYPPDRGTYRFRISAAAAQSEGKPVTFRVDAGKMLMTGKPHLVGYFDAPPEKSTVVEFVDSIEARDTIRLLPYGLASAQAVHKVGADEYGGAGLTVDWIEVEGPLYDAWPPESHRRIFGDLPQEPLANRRDRMEVVSKDPKADAERILQRFLRRALRRNVTEADTRPFLKLVEVKLAENQSFERAMRVALTAVLVSPEFLFLRESPGVLNDFALASRLSYFLWSTMPDDELLAAADSKRLSKPEVLHAHIERMLNDARSAAFVQNFVGQWLGLRDIDFTEPSHLLYPEYDSMLRASMVRETELFFAEVLQHDLSLTHFVDSDFSMLNGRLAKHYGIAGIDGWEFRKTKLPAESHRGGVLTMASVLKVTANGTTTSPVTRGAWVLDRILGTPPPRPPENVAALEPDIRGATTIRELLAKHRQIESCASCHKLIDPPGFALESFDVIGGWRENYRTTGHGESVVVDGRRMPYHKGRKVDPSDVLPDGRAFQNIDELKRLLLADKDLLARSLTTKLATYATGGGTKLADGPQIDAIVAKVRAKNYGLRSLIHSIAESELFRNK